MSPGIRRTFPSCDIIPTAFNRRRFTPDSRVITAGTEMPFRALKGRPGSPLTAVHLHKCRPIPTVREVSGASPSPFLKGKTEPFRKKNVIWCLLCSQTHAKCWDTSLSCVCLVLTEFISLVERMVVKEVLPRAGDMGSCAGILGCVQHVKITPSLNTRVPEDNNTSKLKTKSTRELGEGRRQRRRVQGPGS